MIKYKLHLELWKNDTEGECCQRKTPASNKTKKVFKVFIALVYLLFQGVLFPYLQRKLIC